jgi:undecaprenyl pyrophosphate phosphatase UppP
MSLLKILILAIVQGLAELLPVSSSAHVVVAEKLLGLDPSSPQMTLVLVMLHTGTMFAVIVYFWNAVEARLLRHRGRLQALRYPRRLGDAADRHHRLSAAEAGRAPGLSRRAQGPD